jgi:hypothetical protein
MAMKVVNCGRCNGEGKFWMRNGYGDNTCYACKGSGKKITGQPKKGNKDINSRLMVGDRTEICTSDLGWSVVEVTEVWTRETVDCPPPKIARRLEHCASVNVGTRLYDNKTFIW